MAITVRISVMNPDQWVNGGKGGKGGKGGDRLQRFNAFPDEIGEGSDNGGVIFIDPSLLDSQGLTKTDVVPSSYLFWGNHYTYGTNTIQYQSGNPDIDLKFANWYDTQWASLGWTMNDEATLISELVNWIKINFDGRAENPDNFDYNLVLVRGVLNSTPWSVAFCYPGNQGSVVV